VTSSATWQIPEGVLIFVDWDNTIFPTTWIEEKPKFQQWWKGECTAAEVLSADEHMALQELDKSARGFVVAASQLGKVCCVTLAKRPWVDRTIQAFLPRLAEAWNEIGIETHYASEEKVETRCMSPGSWDVSKQMRANDEESQLAQLEVFSKKKQHSMSKALKKYYGGRRHSWKNVLSFGDGPYERRALQDIGFEHQNPVSSRTGEVKPLKVKTVKLMEDPDVEQICHTLQLLQAWLPKMVFWDTDFDMDLGADGDSDDFCFIPP